jgi:hypothetical protein
MRVANRRSFPPELSVVRSVLLMLGVGALMTAIPSLVQAAPKLKPGPDLSTPTKAATVFAEAADAGDMKRLKQTATGSDSQFAFVKALGDLVQAETHYQTAAGKQFAGNGKLPVFMAVRLSDFVATAREKIDGDKATLATEADRKDDLPIALAQQGGNWKVDLHSIVSAGMEKELKTVRIISGALATVTTAVEAGKYKTADEAFAAVGANYSAAVAPDRTTPKKAAAAFFKAIEAREPAASVQSPQAGDDAPRAAMYNVSTMLAAMKRYETDTLHATAAGTDAQFAAIQGLGDIFAAVRHYDETVTKKFANEGKLPFRIALSSGVDACEENIEGDQATLTDKVNSDRRPPLVLHSEGGNWKVDVNSIDPRTMAIGRANKEVAGAIDTIIKEIESGKFKTGSEALAALGQAMDIVLNADSLK